MIGKLEKLKEVNETLKNLLIQMETRIFIENINVDNANQITKEKGMVTVVEPNQ
jgi:hypothetical protein